MRQAELFKFAPASAGSKNSSQEARRVFKFSILLCGRESCEPRQRLLAVGRGGAGPLTKNWFQESETGSEQKNAFSR